MGFYTSEIRELLKPAGLQDSPDCVEIFEHVGNCVLNWLDESDKPEIAKALGNAAAAVKKAAYGMPDVSGKEARRVFREEFKDLFAKIQLAWGADGETTAFGLNGMEIRPTFVLTTAPLNNNPIMRTLEQKRRGQELGEAALRFKGCFYWAGPSDLDYGGEPSQITQRNPGTITLQSEESKKVFDSFGLKMPDGSFHHPLGGKITTDTLMQQLRETNRNDFTGWLLDGADVDTEFRCNCWEAILISGWWADLIEREKLRALYQTIGKEFKLTNKSFTELLLINLFAFHKSEALADHVHPCQGDIIFFNGAAHLAVATGNGRKVMSLWHQEDSSFAEVSIEFLKSQMGGHCEVRYVPCPF